jgi:hypothetical protein
MRDAWVLWRNCATPEELHVHVDRVLPLVLQIAD